MCCNVLDLIRARHLPSIPRFSCEQRFYNSLFVNELVDPTGLEPVGFNSEGVTWPRDWEIGEVVSAHVDAHDFPRLAEIAAVWPLVGEAVQQAVLTLVRAAQKEMPGWKRQT